MNTDYPTNSYIYHFMSGNKKLLDIFLIIQYFLSVFSLYSFAFLAMARFHSKSVIQFIFHGSWYRAVNFMSIDYMIRLNYMLYNNKMRHEAINWILFSCKNRYETETHFVILPMKNDQSLAKSLFDLWLSILYGITNERQTIFSNYVDMEHALFNLML